MNKLIMGTLLSASILGFASHAYADSEVTSDATISVTAGSNITPPVEPNDPDGSTGQAGPLSIDNVIVFDFQDMQLSGATQTIPLKSQKEQNVQVTDSRGNGNGWNLQVKQSELVNTTDSSKVLKGAYISMNNPKIATTEANVDASNAPTSASQSVTLNNDDFISIMSAEKNNGLGTWYETFQNLETNGIELNVPSGGYAGDYAGTVTWNLSDSPVAGEPVLP